ncbi:MAG: VPLPA-CTERM sorting domain-containing protein [Pseudomonadota bacterium]
MKKIIAAVAASSLLIGAANAASIIIDDFDQQLSAGVGLSGLAEVASNGDTYTSPSALEFNRTINVSSSAALNDNVFIGNNTLTVNSGNLGTVIGAITWELTDTTGGIDLTTSKAFEAGIVNGTVSSSNNVVMASLTLVSGLDTGTPISETVNFQINQGDILLSVDVSNFVSVDLTDIDSITLGYMSDEFEGVDFTLVDALITTPVPVPGALPLMLAGLGFVAARRARRS